MRTRALEHAADAAKPTSREISDVRRPHNHHHEMNIIVTRRSGGGYTARPRVDHDRHDIASIVTRRSGGGYTARPRVDHEHHDIVSIVTRRVAATQPDRVSITNVTTSSPSSRGGWRLHSLTAYRSRTLRHRLHRHVAGGGYTARPRVDHEHHDIVSANVESPGGGSVRRGVESAYRRLHSEGHRVCLAAALTYARRVCLPAAPRLYVESAYRRLRTRKPQGSGGGYTARPQGRVSPSSPARSRRPTEARKEHTECL